MFRCLDEYLNLRLVCWPPGLYRLSNLFLQFPLTGSTLGFLSVGSNYGGYNALAPQSTCLASFYPTAALALDTMNYAATLEENVLDNSKWGPQSTPLVTLTS